MLSDEWNIRPAEVEDAAAIAMVHVASWRTAYQDILRRFYEALGGRSITQQQIERGGESYVEIAYGWSDLSEFDGAGLASTVQ
jgi:hypothetical protein